MLGHLLSWPRQFHLSLLGFLFPLSVATVSLQYLKLIINTFYAFFVCFCSTFLWIALAILCQNCLLCLLYVSTELWLNRGECFFAGSSTRLNRNRLCSLENSFVTTEPEASVLPGRGQEMRILFIWNWTLGFAPVSYPGAAGIHNLGFLMWPITSGISRAVFYLLMLGRVHKH